MASRLELVKEPKERGGEDRGAGGGGREREHLGRGRKGTRGGGWAPHTRKEEKESILPKSCRPAWESASKEVGLS